MKHDVVVVLDNIRSAQNVGSILRSCDGFGVSQVFCCGITPYPKTDKDNRLPHIAERAHRQIAKSSLGAEVSIKTTHFEDIRDLIGELRVQGFQIYAIEQSSRSKPISQLKLNSGTGLILGNEIIGISPGLQNMCDEVYEIPQTGHKESLNVSVAAAIALYQIAIKA
ncbi:MAG: TrmH family RNA methyltransferase [Candidatus Saccharimonadales bacterium]|nr:TrmH family RNA methyltransferase [Candidatus Saccharimonadales bacterium]